MDKEFVGVCLGGDMNSYAIARAFYEEYRIKTIVLGTHPIYPTYPSKIIEGFYDKDILSDKVFLKLLKDVHEKYPEKKKILFGNTDYYVKHIIHNRKKIEKISDTFIIPITSEAMFNKLFSKESFYQLCEKYNLDYPKGQEFDFATDKIKDLKLSVDYPIFMKPSDTVLYSKYNFSGKQKGYKINNKKELEKTLNLIKKSGFNGKFMIQEYIDGDDESMFVFTCYANSHHKVVAVSAGKILMHDRTPELIGNYNAITNAYNKDLSLKLKAFLEAIKFTGICHFDIQYDKKNDRYVVFEMNIRQGRSNYYTLASKTNLAKLIVDDYIYNKNTKFFIANNEFTASIVSRRALKKSLKKHNQLISTKNFSRIALAPYDCILKRYYLQHVWDKKVLTAYYKYN